VRFDKVWGSTQKVGHQQLRYAFDVCWRSRDGRQCRDYSIDLFQPYDVAGLVQPEGRAGAAKRRVASDRANRLSPRLAARLELLALLRDRKFAELTRRVEAAQAAFEQDPSREAETAQLWDAFATADPSVGPLLDAWAEAVPSYAPRVALGIYESSLGWKARGGKWASETPRARFDAMDEHFRRARENLFRALEMHPRLVVAYEKLLSIGRAGGAPRGELLRYTEPVGQICPSCVYPLWIYLESLEPRWGGSYEEMDRFVAGLAPRIAKYPQLAVLAGAAAEDRGDSASDAGDYEAALRLYNEALDHGDYWVYRRSRGGALYRLKRYEEALADQEFQLAHGRLPAQALLSIAYTLGELHRYAEAAEAIGLARQLEPTDEEIAGLARWYDERGLQE
jgi:tetratricopeptide (TPR) repeat protein